METIITYVEDTPTFTFTVKDEDGDYVVLSGLTIYFSARKYLESGTNI